MSHQSRVREHFEHSVSGREFTFKQGLYPSPPYEAEASDVMLQGSGPGIGTLGLPIPRSWG